jgi:hypothetical protein
MLTSKKASSEQPAEFVSVKITAPAISVEDKIEDQSTVIELPVEGPTIFPPPITCQVYTELAFGVIE